jgi:tRNA G18 (ribose-2'-O)-methylase SpoU
MDEQLNSDELQARQKRVREAKVLSGPTIVAIGLSFPENVGGLLRLADAAGCAWVVLVSGSDAQSSDARLRKTARSSEATVMWEVWQQEQFMEQIETFQPIVGLEISKNSKSIFATTLPNPCTILVGGERYGIPSDLLARCQQVIHIPMYGVNGSMNVTHALAIALFEWRRQWTG